MGPTLAGFITFLRDIVQIPADVLPDNSPYILYSYQFSQETVYGAICGVSPFLYSSAIYNLATSILIYTAEDNPALTPPKNTFFADLRKKYSVDSFVAGVIQSSYDDTTGQTLTVPDFFKSLTLLDLQLLKDPWGRQYLLIAQQWGTIWGLS